MNECDRTVLFMDKVFLSPYRKEPRGVELFNLYLVRDLAGQGCRLTVAAHPTWHEVIRKHAGEGESGPALLAASGDSVWGNLHAAWSLRKSRLSVLLLGNVANRLVPLVVLLRWFGVAPRCVLIAHREPSGRCLQTQRLWPSTVLAVNNKIADHFRRTGFKSVAVWYGVMNAERFTPKEKQGTGKEDVNFCVLGHLDSAWKGSDTAIAAFRALPDKVRSRCRLHLAAFHDPPVLSDDGIVVYSWMEPGRMPDFLRQMDVMLVPSRDEDVMRETFSQAMVQGMLSGLPSIVNDLPILTEKLDRGGGLVFRGEEELTKAMVRLAEDAALREKMGREARKTAVERYVWDTQRFVDRFLFPAGGERPVGSASVAGARKEPA